MEKLYGLWWHYKSIGQIVIEEARRGQFGPDKTGINFAVPTKKKKWPNLKVFT